MRPENSQMRLSVWAFSHIKTGFGMIRKNGEPTGIDKIFEVTERLGAELVKNINGGHYIHSKRGC